MEPKKKSHWGGTSSEDIEHGQYKHPSTEEEGYGDHGTDMGMGAPDDEKKKTPEKKP